MTVVTLVAAVAANGVIGRDGGIPWHLPEDLARFREVTMGAPVVMGRRTWESLPERFRPLPGRRNIVVTRDVSWGSAGAERAGSLAEALERAQEAAEVFVIGGAVLYADALPRADRLLLTEIGLDVVGDTVFPAWDRSAFAEVSREEGVSESGLAFAFVDYRRRRP
ncbi:MAG: dihydrofolate reductase [Actinobacteria bacterium]|nr:dihydrofolate reductase [Actinomycetota bacterium]